MDDLDFLILLVYLEDPGEWTGKELQSSIKGLIELVNTASDLTGICTAGLMVDKWGEDPVVSFFVQVDARYDDPEEADTMVVDTFSKAIEIMQLEEDMYVLDYSERQILDAES